MLHFCSFKQNWAQLQREKAGLNNCYWWLASFARTGVKRLKSMWFSAGKRILRVEISFSAQDAIIASLNTIDCRLAGQMIIHNESQGRKLSVSKLVFKDTFKVSERLHAERTICFMICELKVPWTFALNVYSKKVNWKSLFLHWPHYNWCLR